MHDTRRAVLVGTWKGHAGRQLDGSIALDLDLHAVGVELGAAAGVDFERRVSLVQGDELAADEIAGNVSAGFSRGKKGQHTVQP